MLLQQFQQHLKQNFSHLLTGNCKFLLAVSGGIDSVVMTDLFYKSGFDFAIAHCNFQLRGAESDRDEAFVQSLQAKYNREVFIKKFDTDQFAAQHKISIQEAARKLRYDWFEEVNRQLSTVNRQSLIATAHNADDNIETALMFFLRGTGIHGLTGINAFDKQRKIIRPLLFAMRKEIETYAKENNLSWVEDSSNSTDKYARNFFRHNILPLIEQQFLKAKENILENINRFKDVEIVYQQAIAQHKKKLLKHKGNEVHIPVLKLKKTQPLNTFIWEIIKGYNYNAHQIDEVKKLLNASSSKYILSSSHSIIKNRNWLIIAPNNTNELNIILIEEYNKEVRFKNGKLLFEKLSIENYKLQTERTIAQLDATQIEFPLILRKWKQGDYFYPLGMRKKKKLNRFFIDQKLSKTEKENVWVLESNKKIIWVIGYRIDERFKINAATKSIVSIQFK